MPRKITKTQIVFQFLFIAIALGGAGYYTWKHWHEASMVWQRCSPSVILAAAAVTFLGYVLRGTMWSPLLRGVTGIAISPQAAFRVSSIAWMGRYIPGKLWAVAGKAYLSADVPEAVPAAAVAAAVDMAWLLVSGFFIVAVCSVAGLAGSGAVHGYIGIVAVALPLGAVACHPRVYYPITNNLLRRLGKPALPCRPSYALMVLLLFTNIAAFFLWALGIVVMLSPIVDFDFAAVCNVTLIFALGWVSGFLALFAPAGIGVRDTILAVGLKGVFGWDPGTILLAVVGNRVLTTFCEFLCFLVGLGIRDHRKQSETRPR